MKISAPYLTDKTIKAPYLRFVSARLHEMAQSELMAMIAPAIVQEIQARDPKPKFRAYVVGHEGESKGSISPDNQNWFKVIKTWFKSAIRNLHDKIRIGTPLFHGHEDERDPSRETIGEVVGKKLATIKDKLSVIVATYIKPEFATMPFDVASIEADIRLTDYKGEYAADVDDVHAIALANSAVEKPGFKNATLLTQLFEFAENNKNSFRSHDMELTVDDVKKVIKAEGLKPSDIFTNADLSDDPAVKGFIESTEKRTAATFHDRFRRQEEKLKEAEENADKAVKDAKEALEKENKKLKTDLAKSKTSSLFEKEKKDRSLTDKQIKYIEKKLGKFDPEDPEKIDEEFSAFLDDNIKEFKSIAADVFGEKEEKRGEKTGEGDDNGDGDSDESGDQTNSLDDNIFID